jgi:hypothetical protein
VRCLTKPRLLDAPLNHWTATAPPDSSLVTIVGNAAIILRVRAGAAPVGVVRGYRGVVMKRLGQAEHQEGDAFCVQARPLHVPIEPSDHDTSESFGPQDTVVSLGYPRGKCLRGCNGEVARLVTLIRRPLRPTLRTQIRYLPRSEKCHKRP